MPSARTPGWRAASVSASARSACSSRRSTRARGRALDELVVRVDAGLARAAVHHHDEALAVGEARRAGHGAGGGLVDVAHRQPAPCGQRHPGPERRAGGDVAGPVHADVHPGVRHGQRPAARPTSRPSGSPSPPRWRTRRPRRRGRTGTTTTSAGSPASGTPAAAPRAGRRRGTRGLSTPLASRLAPRDGQHAAQRAAAGVARTGGEHGGDAEPELAVVGRPGQRGQRRVRGRVGAARRWRW